MIFEVYSNNNDDLSYQSIVDIGFNTLISIFIIFLFSYFISMFIVPLVEDNQSKFKHQVIFYFYYH